MDVLLTALAAWLVAQIIKLLLDRLGGERFNFAIMTQSGGMPSSHTALVTAAALRVGSLEGFDTALFGMSTVFALIVMYDAAGVRHSVGQQAKILNKIQEELKALVVAFDADAIKEVLGHTTLQVGAGFVLGALTALAAAQLFPR